MLDLIASLALVLNDSAAQQPARAAWTIAFYAAGDNSSEESVISDLQALADSLRAVPTVQVILLIDRSPRYDNTPGPFGEDFSDTRLYRIASDGVTRLAGGAELPAAKLDASWEMNVGDPANVRGLLRFAAAHYPAERTALWFYSHGDGKSLCPEETGAADSLHPPELSAALEERDSVDLLVLDVCSMAGVENAYEWRRAAGRFGASAMVASASVSAPFPYAMIFERFAAQPNDAAQPALDPRATDALAFGNWIVDAIRASRVELEKREPFPFAESYACLDLAHAAPLKQALDALAVAAAAGDARALLERVRDAARPAGCRCYADDPKVKLAMPYYDALDFARGIAADAAASPQLRAAAETLAKEVDALVASSTITSAGADFERGSNGVFVVFPDGGRALRKNGRAWRQYKPFGPKPYLALGAGGYAMHKDGAITGDAKVQTWWECLDAWFDVDNEAAGGLDETRW